MPCRRADSGYLGRSWYPPNGRARLPTPPPGPSPPAPGRNPPARTPLPSAPQPSPARPGPPLPPPTPAPGTTGRFPRSESSPAPASPPSMGFVGWSAGLAADEGPKALLPAGAGPSSGMGISGPGLGFSNVVVSGPGGGPGDSSGVLGRTCFARWRRLLADVRGFGERFFYGLRWDQRLHLRWRKGLGGGGGGFATITSVFERISGGVSGVTSDVATGSGTGGGGATVTISAGMRSARRRGQTQGPPEGRQA